MADENKDVFGLDGGIGGAWSLDGAVLNLGEYEEGLVVTAANITYQRRSQKFSPLNQKKKYLITGEADGQLTLGVIIGPSDSVIEFIKEFSDPCNVLPGGKQNVISLSPVGTSFQKCKGKFSPIYFTCHGCLINQIAVSVSQAGGALTVLTAGLTLAFCSLTLDKTGPAANTSQGATGADDDASRNIPA